MKIRPINLEVEYPSLTAFWSKRGAPPPPQVILQGAAGFAVNAGIDIVVGFIYRSANVAFVEWITSNPAVAASPTVADAVRTFMDFANTYAKGEGANVILCSTRDNGSLGRFLETLDYKKCEGPPHQFYVKGAL